MAPDSNQGPLVVELPNGGQAGTASSDAPKGGDTPITVGTEGEQNGDPGRSAEEDHGDGNTGPDLGELAKSIEMLTETAKAIVQELGSLSERLDTLEGAATAPATETQMKLNADWSKFVDMLMARISQDVIEPITNFNKRIAAIEGKLKHM